MENRLHELDSAFHNFMNDINELTKSDLQDAVMECVSSLALIHNISEKNDYKKKIIALLQTQHQKMIMNLLDMERDDAIRPILVSVTNNHANIIYSLYGRSPPAHVIISGGSCSTRKMRRGKKAKKSRKGRKHTRKH